ncbi:D-inositol 3-phosphate glycosyltransferase [Streptomyces sp. MP131-18]|nr:D-inositol 3-phosphate glycosyltransferase [Streptomyces sp. MP131-18]
MRIAALVHYYVPHYMAGSETMLHAMLRALAVAGHEVEAVVTEHRRGPDEYVHEGVRVRRAVRGRPVPAILDAIGADVLVSHHQEAPHASHYAARARRRGEPAPAVAHVAHNTFPASLAVTRRWRPDLLVFNTVWVREHFARRRAIPPGSRTLVVHPPVWPDEHRVDQHGDAVTLVNLNRDKGGEILYRLADRMPDMQFAGVVGGHGPQIVRDLPNVEIIQHTAQMRRDVWPRTRLLIMPSIYESYGMAGVEAMASGIPVIAAPTPGLREALGDAGMFVERGDLGGWERQIRRLLDPVEWETASTAALKRSVELDPREELAAWVQVVESLS